MNLIKCSIVVVMIVCVAAGTCVAQSRIQLAQGRRAIQDKVSFVIEINREKTLNPRYAEKPEDMRVWMRFGGQATGKVYVDGKAIGRFDESMSFYSNMLDTTYGRHTITVSFAAAAILIDAYVDVRGGVAREILDEQEPSVALAPDLSRRVAELERKVSALEVELADFKKKRNH
ncbi:MAG TPA: hypothetical protein VF251_08920 [Pyrinomonadaceae bacterium]